MKKTYVYVLLTGLVFVLLISSYKWNGYRERALVDVLEAGKITEIHFNVPPFDDSIIYNTAVKDEESIQELIAFFSRYQVQKKGNENFSSKYPKEQFIFLLRYNDLRMNIPYLIERDVVIVNEDHYTITNGPIDYEWIETFKNNHSDSFSSSSVTPTEI